MEAVAVGGLKRARCGAYNGPEAAGTLKKHRLDAASAAAAAAATAAAAVAAAAAMNMAPTGTPPAQQQGAVVDGSQVTGLCNNIDPLASGEEEVNIYVYIVCVCVYICLSNLFYCRVSIPSARFDDRRGNRQNIRDPTEKI